MHIYFGIFFAAIALVAIILLLWNLLRPSTATPAPSAYPGPAADPLSPEPGSAPTIERWRRLDNSTLLGGAWFSIFLFLLISPDPISTGYKGTILFCLLVAGLALLFYRMVPGPDAIAGGCLLLIWGVLFFAFADQTPFGIPSPLVLLAPAVGALAYFQLARPFSAQGARPVPGFHATGIAFIVILGLTSWAVLELIAGQPRLWTLAAGVGILFFWITIGIYAQQRTGMNRLIVTDPADTPATARPDASTQPLYPAVSVLAAMWFLALSVWQF